MRTNIFANEFKNMVKRPVEMVVNYFGCLISVFISLWTIKNSYAGVSLAKI